MYEFDPSRIDLAREFRARPYGEHSPDLQYLLNLMHKPRAGPFYMLVMTEPYRRWTLAVKEAGTLEPPRLTNTVFESPEEAEWHVFRLRWEEMSGEALEIDA